MISSFFIHLTAKKLVKWKDSDDVVCFCSDHRFFIYISGSTFVINDAGACQVVPCVTGFLFSPHQMKDFLPRRREWLLSGRRVWDVLTFYFFPFLIVHCSQRPGFQSRQYFLLSTNSSKNGKKKKTETNNISADVKMSPGLITLSVAFGSSLLFKNQCKCVL